MTKYTIEKDTDGKYMVTFTLSIRLGRQYGTTADFEMVKTAAAKWYFDTAGVLFHVSNGYVIATFEAHHTDYDSIQQTITDIQNTFDKAVEKLMTMVSVIRMFTDMK